MAETFRINVTVNTEAERRALQQAFANLQARNAATNRQPGLRGSISSMAQSIGREAISAPFNVLGGAASAAGRTLLGFVGPLASLASSVTLGAGGIVAAAAVLITVGIPLFNLAATFKILRTSFAWAQDAAEAQTRVIARTRRTFPGVIGEAFERAAGQTRTKLAVASALFGDGAEQLSTQIMTRFTESRMQRGMGGDRDLFARLGITQQAINTYEEMTGQRMGITDWLELFIRTREKLDAQTLAARGTGEEGIWMRRNAMFFDSTLRLFGQKFTDIITKWSTADRERLTAQLARSAPLAMVGTESQMAENTSNFQRALRSLQGTFSNLKDGIATALTPLYTQSLTQINDWLLQTTSSGVTMGQQFRDLAISLGLQAWQTLRNLVGEINPETVKLFIDEIKKWHFEDTLATLGTAARMMGEFAAEIGRFTDWIAYIWGRLHGRGEVRTYDLFGFGRRRQEAEEAESRGEDESWWRRLSRFGGGAGLGTGPAAGYYDRPSIGGRAATGGRAPVFRGRRLAGRGVDETGGAVTNAPTPTGPMLGPAKALEFAQQHLGARAIQDRNQLQQFFNNSNVRVNPATTAWCAAYVNASLGAAGIKGTGSAIATSFLNWGNPVAPKNVAAGDVLVEARGRRAGQTGGHVGMATGRTMVKNGELYVEFLGGNQGFVRGNRGVTTAWRPASILDVRRMSGAGTMAAGQGTEAASAAPTSPSGDTLTNGRGQIDRSRFARELAASPALQSKVLAIAANEQSNPQGQQAVIETMMNRAATRGTSLAQQARWTGEGGYYDSANGVSRGVSAANNATVRAGLQSRLDAALAGSNIAQYATDNASNQPGNRLADKRLQTGWTRTAVINGEHFFLPDPTAPRWQAGHRRWREQQRAQAAQAVPSPTPQRAAPPATASLQPASNVSVLRRPAPDVVRERQEATDDQQRAALTTAESLKADADKAREAITKPAPKKVIDEGTAAGKAAADAFKEGIKDTSIPVKSLSDEEKNREQQKEAA